jgi:hypothetical protein
MDVQQQFLHKKRRDKSKTTSSRQKVLLTVNVSFSENSNCDKPNMIPFWIAFIFR